MEGARDDDLLLMRFTGNVALKLIEGVSQAILGAVRKHFDLRPGAIIRDLNLRRPIYQATAAYGHFGRNDIDAPWERLDKVDALRKAAGL